jgi:DNA-binding NtrC family response regulator
MKEVERGTFRSDLYYRLNVVTIRLSPLRERPEDIPVLADHFLARYSGNYRFTEDAMDALMSYEWPGNVRQLENCIQQMVAVNSGPLLHVAQLPSPIQHYLKRQSVAVTARLPEQEPNPEVWLNADCPVVPLAELERRAILNAIRYTRGDRNLAAVLLGIGRTTLYRKLREYEQAGYADRSRAAGGEQREE